METRAEWTDVSAPTQHLLGMPRMSIRSQSDREAVIADAAKLLPEAPGKPAIAAGPSALTSFYSLAVGDGIWGTSKAAARMGYRGHDENVNLLEEIAANVADEAVAPITPTSISSR
jgi:hypothetical protein